MTPQINSIVKIISTVVTIAIAAQITIDVGSIPITGQTLAILCWAFFLTTKESFIALSTYLLLGFAGIPIFADGASGIEKLYGGSGGFLVGFLLAAIFISVYRKYLKSNSFFNILNLTFFGTQIIVLCGVGRLSALYGFEKGVEYGFTPFWKGAVVKIFIGSLLVWLIKRYSAKTNQEVSA